MQRDSGLVNERRDHCGRLRGGIGRGIFFGKEGGQGGQSSLNLICGGWNLTDDCKKKILGGSLEDEALFFWFYSMLWSWVLRGGSFGALILRDEMRGGCPQLRAPRGC